MLSFFENKKESCTGQDLADLGERLRDWFQLLQTNAKQNNNSKQAARVTAGAATTSGRSVCGRGLETFRRSSCFYSSSVEKPAGKEGKIRNLCCCCVCLAALSASSLEGFHSRLINIEEIKTAAGFSLSCRLMSGK